MKTLKTTAILTGLTGSLFVAAAASAGTVTATGYSFIHQTETVTGTVVGATPSVQSGYAGVARFTGRAGTAPEILLTNSPEGTFFGICLEINELVEGNPFSWDLVSLTSAPLDAGGSGGVPMTAARASDLAKLLDAKYSNWGSAPDNVSALQLAVWEIANEDSGVYNLTNGRISFTNVEAANLSLAQKYLDDLPTYAAATGLYMAITDSNFQDFVVKVVPIPAAAWLLGSGLLGLFGLARRKKAAAAA